MSDDTGAPGAAVETNSDDTITIVLSDGLEMVRAGLLVLLDRAPGLAVVADVPDAAEAARALAIHRPRVLVLDLGLTGGAHLAAVGELREAHPETAVVVLALHSDPELAREALRLGARAFVLKSASEIELIQAVRLAADGRTYLSPELGARLAADRGERSAPDELSRRELEVLRLIAHGHTNSEIATQLYLSVRTVESHRARIQHKLGRSGRAELVAHARELGLA